MFWLYCFIFVSANADKDILLSRCKPYRKFVNVLLANQRQRIDQNDVIIIISRWRFTEGAKDENLNKKQGKFVNLQFKLTIKRGQYNEILLF